MRFDRGSAPKVAGSKSFTTGWNVVLLDAIPAHADTQVPDTQHVCAPPRISSRLIYTQTSYRRKCRWSLLHSLPVGFSPRNEGSGEPESSDGGITTDLAFGNGTLSTDTLRGTTGEDVTSECSTL